MRNEPDRRIVIAVRGSDNLVDWTGPNAAVARDAEWLDLANVMSPQTDRTRRQMAWIQDKLLPGEAWDPQFGQLLDFAKEIRDTYEPRGYTIEGTGHSQGGAGAQLISETFGWGGRSFDAPGAANVTGSRGYRDWLQANDVTPAGVPRFKPAPFDSGFLNYAVNNSVVSHKTGEHLGQVQSISSFVGREGLASHARHAVGIVGGGIAETPLLGEALKTTGSARMASTVMSIAHGSQHGVDAFDRHDMGRIVRVFEEAVRRQERGDRQPLPILGEQQSRSLPPLAGSDGERARTGPEQPPATRSLFDGLGETPLSGLMARDGNAGERMSSWLAGLQGSGAAQAWLQSGRERLQAVQQDLSAGAQVTEGQEQAGQPSRDASEQALLR